MPDAKGSGGPRHGGPDAPRLPDTCGLEPRLVNGPFGDPGLYVGLKWAGQAFLFDAGSLERLPSANLSRVTHLFISHTHVDHFIGFDRILRLLLARNTSLKVFGPPGIISNVRGKLAAYTWNLVDGYDFTIEVHELGFDGVRRVALPAAAAFAPQSEFTSSFHGVVHNDGVFEVRAAHLDHRIPCLAYVLEELPRLRVKKDALATFGVAPGAWLGKLKEAIGAGAADSKPFELPVVTTVGGVSASWTIGELRRRLLEMTPGTRLGYVVDVAFHPGNVERLQTIASGLDVLFCEASFLDADRDEATKRFHLTARQAGKLAQAVGANQLVVFHFSSRYSNRGAELYAEAQDSFEEISDAPTSADANGS